MPFLLAEILNFQGSTHLIGVGSLSYLKYNDFILINHPISSFRNKNDVVSV